MRSPSITARWVRVARTQRSSATPSTTQSSHSGRPGGKGRDASVLMQLEQLVVPAGRIDGGGGDVVGHVEPVRAGPHRPLEVEGDLHRYRLVAGEAVQQRDDPGPDLVERRGRALQHGHVHERHVVAVRTQLDEPGLLGAEARTAHPATPRSGYSIFFRPVRSNGCHSPSGWARRSAIT